MTWPLPPPSVLVPPFADAVVRALSVAALSPSSHNSQPWALAHATSAAARSAAAALLAAEDRDLEYVVLALDRSRQLQALPAHALEMRLSCGAFWEVLLRGLAAQGWAVDRLRFELPSGPQGDLGPRWPQGWLPLGLAALRPDGRPRGTLEQLRAAARRRRTNRGPYLPDRVDSEVLRHLGEPSADAVGCGDGVGSSTAVRVRHLTVERDREVFAALVARHAGRDYSHARAWRETYSYLRWDDEDARARGDGLLLPGPTGRLAHQRQRLARLALVPSVMRVLRHVDYPERLARRLAAVARATPALVAMSFDSSSPRAAEVLGGGARLVDYWLRAGAAGLALHPVSVVLQHEDVRKELQGRLGLSGRTYFISRLGRPRHPAPVSPRRPGAAAYRAV